MVEKIKTNKHGDCIYTEQDAINLLYTQPDFDITKLFLDSPDKYNDTIQELGIDLPKIQKAPARGDVLEFDKHFVIQPIQAFWGNKIGILGGVSCSEGFRYASNCNCENLSDDELKDLLKDFLAR